MKWPFAAALSGALTLAGCAAPDVDAPSLLPRSIEQLSFDEPEIVPVKVAPDPALDAALATAEARLGEAATAFATAARHAADLVAAAGGASAGSDPWLDAQVALAELDGKRADTLAIASDLDQRATDRGVSGEPDYPALERARAAAQQEVTAETDRIDALAAALPAS